MTATRLHRAWPLALAGILAACAATESSELGDGDDDSSAGSGGATSTSTGSGSEGGTVLSGSGGSTSSGPPATLECPSVPQEILVLDFRSGWWTGGGGGEFSSSALPAMVEHCSGLEVEYHHFEVDFRIKCGMLSGGSVSCQTLNDSINSATPQQILGWFNQQSWDDYTQVWILSGSDLDAADVSMTSSLFSHFLAESNGSCTPVLIGAGDGFITHGNSVSRELGLGDVFSTEFAAPGFFTVAMATAPQWVTVTSHMQGQQLTDHVLFTDVNSVADTMDNNLAQQTHGDSITELSTTYQTIAHDTQGRPAIAVGDIALPGGDDRPFIIDAGFQRFYAIDTEPDTRQLLQNMVMYLSLVGCKADPPK